MGVTAGALGAALGASTEVGFLGILASFGAAVALVAAAPQLIRPQGDPAGTHLRQVAVSFLAVAVVGEAITFAWARGWIEHLVVAVVLVVVASLGTALAWVVRARPEGLWPTPPAPRPPAPGPPDWGTGSQG